MWFGGFVGYWDVACWEDEGDGYRRLWDVGMGWGVFQESGHTLVEREMRICVAHLVGEVGAVVKRRICVETFA